ncbi:DNA-methyltransferase [Methylotenera sp. N17]|uniref:DNA-methyltransferase n=1 Tax=Methylotenera sp. N17 TaxID=1502761 RepID=UPI000ABD4B74|nr:site-specific DNA-methyltransferase [Methylotenera sp. N17]
MLEQTTSISGDLINSNNNSAITVQNMKSGNLDKVKIATSKENLTGRQSPIILSPKKPLPATLPDFSLWNGDVEAFLKCLPEEPIFDMIVSSPPYNIGKAYESKASLEHYLNWQERIIDLMIPLLKDTGSLCWQVGNYVDNGQIIPLDIEFAPIFKKHALQLRNRIIWHFGHGLHTKHRFSGRYETVMWYTKTDNYLFDVDPIRVPSKYPGKKHFKGPNAGKLSGNPLGKNPEDVWSIPNVKSNHVEKTDHPCQFPVGLIERLVLSMSKPGGLIFDPYAGVASTGVAAAIHDRKFIGCELNKSYVKTGIKRLQEALDGVARYRPHDKPIYDHTSSALSRSPEEWSEKEVE